MTSAPHAVSERVFASWNGEVVSDVPFHPRVDTNKTPAAWLGCQDQPEFDGYIPDDKVAVYRHYHPQTQRVLSRPRVRSGTENWLNERMLHITATNAAPILAADPELKRLGLRSPYQTRQQIFAKKTGRGRPFARNKYCDHGHFYEPEALRVYEMVTGIEVVPEDVGLLIYEKNPAIAATPDAIAKHFPIIIEVKCPFRRKITHEQPDYYMPQTMVQMAVCEVRTCHFVQYTPPTLSRDGKIDIIELTFDEALWLKCLNVLLTFWDEVKAYYTSVDKPIGTQLVDWSEKKHEQQILKRRRLLLDPPRSCMLAPTQELNRQMAAYDAELKQRGDGNADQRSGSRGASVATEHDKIEFDWANVPSKYLIRSDSA